MRYCTILALVPLCVSCLGLTTPSGDLADLDVLAGRTPPVLAPDEMSFEARNEYLSPLEEAINSRLFLEIEVVSGLVRLAAKGTATKLRDDGSIVTEDLPTLDWLGSLSVNGLLKELEELCEGESLLGQSVCPSLPDLDSARDALKTAEDNFNMLFFALDDVELS